MKEKKFYIETSKAKYLMVFNLNVMQEIQDEFGSTKKWGEISEDNGSGEPNVKALIKGLRMMLNEGIEIENEEEGTNKPLLTEKQVGRIISERGLQEITKDIQDVTINSVSTGEEPKNE